MRADWVSVGKFCFATGERTNFGLQKAIERLRRIGSSRIRLHRWYRYSVELDNVPKSTTQLTPLSEEIMNALATHPEREGLATNFRFWHRGLRHGFLWIEDNVPICIQALLTEADNSNLRNLGEWAGMYPPLPPGTGQVEGLYAFKESRRRGAATEFEYGLYARAKELGLRELVTHIAVENDGANGWAAKTGWRVIGEVVRIAIDLPLLRGVPLYLHSSQSTSNREAPAPLHSPRELSTGKL